MASSRLRMTGLISGMDTEAIISALVSTRKSKVTKTVGEQTKLSWKQETWKDLNKQLKSLQSTAMNMRFSSNYAKKTTNVSDSSRASVITGDGAINSVQSLEIKELAKTAYITSAKIDKTTSGEDATALTTLGDLGFSGNGTINITKMNKSISVSSSSTISDVLSQLQEAGLNASFDAKNQRLFVSAKASGDAYDFDLEGADDDGKAALAKLGLVSSGYYTDAQSYTSDQVNATVAKRLAANLASYKSLNETRETLDAEIAELKSNYSVSDGDDVAELLNTANENLTALRESLDNLSRDDFESDEAYEAQKASIESDIEAAQARVDGLTQLSGRQTQISDIDTRLAAIETSFAGGAAVKNEDGTYSATASDTLKASVESDYSARATEALANAGKQGLSKVTGSDAVISLNGAEFKSDTNVFEVNGLTITALAKTDENKPLTLTTQNDTSGMYDMIKKFITTYNSVMNKLDSLYNAESAKGYSPLTDEEKDSLSESEVEKYEKKIKDALLRHDSNVSKITTSLTSIMAGGIKVGEDTMYLSDFGISTLSYFTSEENEKHAFHIDGDKDDENVADKEDLLLKMITADPDKTVSFFTELSNSMYQKMTELSSSVAGYRSFGSFYDDKKMATDYSSYTTKISELEDKVSAYEDKLYKQYSAMETALAKLQSNSSAVTGLLNSGS